MGTEEDLYSADPATRFRASTHAPTGEREVIWPRGCHGAANGWLMLLGPSPGRQDSDDEVWPGGPNRPVDSPARIGPNAGRVNYGTNRGRNARWNMLSKAIFGSLDHAHALTTVANLDWGHHPDSNAIPAEYLVEGCEVVFELMQQSKPRIVVTLVRRTWDFFSPFIADRAQPVEYEAATQLASLVVRVPGLDAEILVVRSPQHPSWHFFNVEHAAMLRAETRNFLGEPVVRESVTEVSRPRALSRRRSKADGYVTNPTRDAIEGVFNSHGYHQFTAARDQVRIADKRFGESLAVQPKSEGLTLWVRWKGSANRIEHLRAHVGGEQEGNVLGFHGLDLASLDQKLGEVVTWLESHGR